MIIVDLNSVGFAATAANAELRAGSTNTGGVFGTLRTLRDVRTQFNGKMVILHDGRSWRYDEYPEYKGNRKVIPELVALKEKWKPQKKLVAQFLARMNVTQMLSENMEADDLAARIVKSHPDSDITLVTGDGDWRQLISERVMWFNPIGGPRTKQIARITHHTFKEYTGYDTPWMFVQAKALTGDQGDNIPGVGGLGDKAAEFIFEKFGSVQGMLNEANTNREAFESLHKKYRSFVDSEEKIEAYRRNLRLVWLNHPGLPAAKKPRIIKGSYDADKFADLCGELAFHDIMRNPDAWMEPFIELDEERIAA